MIWSVGDLDVNTPQTLKIVTQVLTDGTFVNIAIVNTTTPESNNTNNEANNTTEADPICDLEIIKLVSAKKAYVGEELTWTIKVTNNGPSDAYDVKVLEDIPKSLKLISYKASKGSFNKKTNIWTIGKLESDSSVTLLIVTKVLSVGNITNPVEVSTTTPDSNKTNDKANNTTEAICIVDLAVVKSADKKVYHVNDKMYWVVTVINYGPCDAHEVVASDVLPDGLKLISYKSSKGVYDKSSGKWKIGDLEIGESVTLYLYCKVLREGQITNCVNVTCNETDSNLSNNYDNCTVKVIKNDTPTPEPDPKPDHSKHPVTMKNTGNPIAFLLLALLAIFGSFWSKNRKE